MGTIVRVTEQSMAAKTLDNMMLSLQGLQDIQTQLSTGRKINRPSDDPIGTSQAMQLRTKQARTEQYSRNSDDAMGWLGTADTTLGSTVDEIQRVRTLIVQGANGTSDSASRKALADEIGTIKQGLVGLANTQYNGRSIFAGTANPGALAPPRGAYDADGTYNGNTGAVNRTIGPNASVQVNVDGQAVFGSGANDLWTLLDDIQAHLNSTDPVDHAKLTGSHVSGGVSVLGDLDRLDAARINIQNRQSEVGARYHRVETMQTRAQDDLLTTQNSLASIENIDLPKTIVALNLKNTAYQAALAATAKVIVPSLVDFLG